MNEQYSKRSGIVLPLPRFIFLPLTSVILALVHIYLASGHLYHLFTGELLWTNIWKGFGALFGAYVFAALAFNGYTSKSKKGTEEQVTFDSLNP